MGKQSDADIFWRPCVHFGRSPRGRFALSFSFSPRSAISRARGGGGGKKGTKRKKGDAFTYIEVFKRLIASGDAMTR
jgi:hypothetical protein